MHVAHPDDGPGGDRLGEDGPGEDDGVEEDAQARRVHSWVTGEFRG